MAAAGHEPTNRHLKRVLDMVGKVAGAEIPVAALHSTIGRHAARAVRTAVLASLSDYLDLVDCHRGTLPRLTLDPNPYWMGFYASRPGLKRACRRLMPTSFTTVSTA